MKGRIARFLACSMVVMLLASGMPEDFGYKAGTSEKEHTAYAAVTGYISSYDELVEAATTGGVYVLSNSIVLTKTVIIPEGVDLTLLQETGSNNKITSVTYSEDLLRVSEGASLTLGSKDTDVIFIDGSNLTDAMPLITVRGTLTIENADITCEKGVGVVVRKGGRVYMNDGYIHDCKYSGISTGGEGSVIAGGRISNCEYAGISVGETGVGCKITGVTISDITYYGIECLGACTMTGGLVTGCSYGVYAGSGAAFSMAGGVIAGGDYGIYTDSSMSSVIMSGGVVSNSETYALYPKYGSIYLLGGNIQNGRCTTYSEGNFYIGESPYLDASSFILVREGAPLIQVGALSAPEANPYAKINVYGMTIEQPLVTSLSEDMSLWDSLELYQPYDRDFTLSVKENQIYMEGTKEIDKEVYPTVRPVTSDETAQPTPSAETIAPIITEEPTKPSLPWFTTIPITTEEPTQSPASFTTTVPVPTEEPMQSSAPQTTTIPTVVTEKPMQSSTPQITTIPTVVTEEPMQSSTPQTTTIPTVATEGSVQSSAPQTTTIPTKPLETPAATQQASTTIPGGESTPEPVATQNVYEEFSSTRPEITKISAKGLDFQLQWKFSSAVPVREYAIYYSSDQKKYSLIKTVDAAITSTSLSISKAYNGKKIYFYVVAKTTDAVSGNVYQSEKSYVASKYLIDKVTGMTGSFHTSTQKLTVKWKKVSNCTGYYVYIKARCNGKTLTKRCATVSKKKNSVSISTQKIKRKFSSNGKPIHIKKYSVRAFYKKGEKTAYSPN